MLAVAAAAVVATGCSGTAASQDATRVPVGALQPLTDTEQLRVADAEQRLIKQCLNRHGFTYWEAERLSLEESRTLGYVADDVAWARKHGYGSRIAAKEDRARLNNPNLVYRKGLSEERRKAYDEAMDGGIDAQVITAEVPGGRTVNRQMGGCVAEAEKKLYGDTRAWFRADKISMNLQQLYVSDVMRDKQFTTALNAWSRCMRRVGHPYGNPGEARQAAKGQSVNSASAKTFAAERRLAVADATCARDASLRSIGTNRETHYLNKLRDKYGEAIDTSRRIQREALTRAQRIVGPRA
ncbi:hypothetical protein [Streptomyces sp. V3I8]|uniref:hypothetical protein n=1 Tax=Streptomyces sp. V3I8 TaxID=3042279 RepID=UPI0027D8B656|nr:hypothetical protein [Streptomyces sp. V3I8]